jgi:hypothetical protein
MLMKGKRLIALLSSKNPGIRHPAERQSEILLPQGGTPQVRFQDSDGVHRTPAIGDDSATGNVGGHKNGRSRRTIPRVTHFTASVIDSARSEDESICGLREFSMARSPDHSIARCLMAFQAQ